MLFRSFFGRTGILTRTSSSVASQWQTVAPKYPDEFDIPKYDGPSLDELQTIRQNHLSPNYKTIYDEPLIIHNGKMQWLFDHTGRKYLDMFAGIVTVSVGHCHPHVTAAVEKQLKQLWHTTLIYLHPNIHKYAQELVNKLPGDLKVAYFLNSGSEANDLAALLARLSTENFELISLQNGYHGMSPFTQGLTAHGTWRHSIPGLSNGIHHAKNPDPYNGIWGGVNCRHSPVQTSRNCNCEPNVSECDAGDKYYQELESLFKYSLPIGKCAGMFAESIQGVGGVVQYPKGYLKKAAELVRKNGGVFISDEVQTGFGRTGEHFWGFESHDIVPDIVTMAKGMGNGFPLAAVVTTPKIAKSLEQAKYFNTYGGNPMAMAAGLAVLEVIEREGLQRNALEVGTYYLKSLEQLRNTSNIVGDVRGQGLMIGVELVEDKSTRKPLPAKYFNKILNETKNRGVLFGNGGLYGNILRIKPPMCITKTDVDLAVDVLSESLKEVPL